MSSYEVSIEQEGDVSIVEIDFYDTRSTFIPSRHVRRRVVLRVCGEAAQVATFQAPAESGVADAQGVLDASSSPDLAVFVRALSWLATGEDRPALTSRREDTEP